MDTTMFRVSRGLVAAGPVRVGLVPVPGAGTESGERWGRLADAAVEPNPFAAPDVVIPAVRHLPGGEHVRLLTVERAGELIFALPVTRGRAHRRVPVPVLQAWSDYDAPLATPLLHPDHAVLAWLAVRAALGGLRAAWLRLDPMAIDGPVAGALAEAAGRRGLPERYAETWQRGAVRRDGTVPPQSGRTRRSQERRRRRLAAMLGHDVELGFHSGDPGPPAELVERFLNLEASGWKGRAGTAMRDRPGQARFFRELAERHRARGRLEIVTLHGGERLVAANVNVVAGDTVFCLKTAYDEEFAACSPGRLIADAEIHLFRTATGHALMDSCASPDSELVDQMYPDRRTMATVIVPGTSPGADLASRTLLTAHDLRTRRAAAVANPA